MAADPMPTRTPDRPALDGRVAVVTGGAKGIGWATVEALADAGAIPVLFDRDAAALKDAGARLAERRVEHSTQEMDVADEASVDAAFAAAIARFGRIDVLVNNAGIALRRPTVELAAADWRAVVDVNLTGVFLCARAAARSMIGARRGSVIQVASIMGLSGGGLYPNISYQSTKGALVNLTRALAVEWAPHGIRVNAVAPTWVATDLTRGLMADPDLQRRILELTPLRRLAEPADIADAIVFLASDRAKMITGHTLPVDGGFLAQ
jgi:NAD(P)-dependent dehydrogenase (short-subunit alcohol dehydrogenase family)